MLGILSCNSANKETKATVPPQKSEFVAKEFKASHRD